MLKRLNKAQSTAEYAIVIGLVIAAALAMQVYVKRQLQGKVKDATDFSRYRGTDFGVPTGYGIDNAKEQYEPYYATSEITSSSNRQESTETFTGGGVEKIIPTETPDRTEQYGTRNILASPNN